MEDKTELIKELTEFSKQVITNKTMTSYYKKKCNTKYKVLDSVSMQWLSNPDSEISKMDLINLYYFAMSLEETAYNYGMRNSFSRYFTKEEEGVALKKLTEEKQQKKVNMFPVIFNNCLRVNEEQWVTTITAKELDRLDRNNIIFYNKNTQRQMTRRVFNGIETYNITLKESSVNAIARDMENGMFISNAITLNINEDDVNTEFDYDVTTAQIIIKKGKLDIIDGYHRYRAMMKNIAVLKDFDYPMILNIVAFSEEKANRYIVQEDKRNKINNAHLKSIDDTSMISQLIKRINTTSGSTLNKIGRDDEINKISQRSFYEWINKFMDIKTKEDIIKYKKIFCYVFSEIDDEYGDIGKLSFCQLGIVVYCIATHEDISYATNLTINILKNYEFNEARFTRKAVNKRSVEAIKEYVKDREEERFGV